MTTQLDGRLTRLEGRRGRLANADAEPSTPLESLFWRLNRMTPDERAGFFAEVDAQLRAEGYEPTPDPDLLTRRYPEYWRARRSLG